MAPGPLAPFTTAPALPSPTLLSPSWDNVGSTRSSNVNFPSQGSWFHLVCKVPFTTQMTSSEVQGIETWTLWGLLFCLPPVGKAQSLLRSTCRPSPKDRWPRTELEKVPSGRQETYQLISAIFWQTHSLFSSRLWADNKSTDVLH